MNRSFNYSTWYLTLNKGQLLSYFWITIPGQVICRSLEYANSLTNIPTSLVLGIQKPDGEILNFCIFSQDGFLKFFSHSLTWVYTLLTKNKWAHRKIESLFLFLSFQSNVVACFLPFSVNCSTLTTPVCF